MSTILALWCQMSFRQTHRPSSTGLKFVVVPWKIVNFLTPFMRWVIKSILTLLSVICPSHQALNQFRQGTPGAGAYFNEADYFEVGWQEQFWGMDNYNKLLSIKSTWDPEGLFTCYNCVGSESWDRSGMCRIRPRYA